MFKIIYKLFAFAFFILTVSLDCGGNIQGEKNHTFYFYSKSSNAIIKTMPENNACNLLYFKNHLKGESVEFLSEKSATEFINKLNAKHVFSEKGEDFYCEYYYTNQINDYITINGYKINVHLSYGNGVFIVGTPIIFGSF